MIVIQKMLVMSITLIMLITLLSLILILTTIIITIMKKWRIIQKKKKKDLLKVNMKSLRWI